MLTTERIRSVAPQARLDETVAQPGVVQRLGAFAAGDPLDLALYLVKLAHLRQRSS